MSIKLKSLLEGKTTLKDIEKWFEDNKKRLSLKKFVDEINKMKDVKAEVRDMTYDSPSRAGSRVVDRSKVKGLDIWYKRNHFRAHTKSYDPIGNRSLIRAALRFLEEPW